MELKNELLTENLRSREEQLVRQERSFQAHVTWWWSGDKVTSEGYADSVRCTEANDLRMQDLVDSNRAGCKKVQVASNEENSPVCDEDAVEEATTCSEQKSLSCSEARTCLLLLLLSAGARTALRRNLLRRYRVAMVLPVTATTRISRSRLVKVRGDLSSQPL
eukprot:754856-Hanusia_phi.AAC.4